MLKYTVNTLYVAGGGREEPWRETDGPEMTAEATEKGKNKIKNNIHYI